MAKKQRIPHKFQPWIDARKKFRLSNAHIQMARELGLSPKRFSSYADNTGQPWKVPLPEFIEAQYEKQFGKTRPDEVMSIEEIAAAHLAKRMERKKRNAAAEAAAAKAAANEQIDETEAVPETEPAAETEPAPEAERMPEAE
ncbi:hypothetical protein NHH03_16710 [Stieleria sp. TO1_6]|uniref:hypothetical protein n=1 Tax=Stieleria tagensis TaxID=2956795 RepID=UPI00209A6DD1|nr:hypothetical protein [Stieleria tagensis]MCO8123394.1 hypothetical protein [Stieleria tagensis]